MIDKSNKYGIINSDIRGRIFYCQNGLLVGAENLTVSLVSTERSPFLLEDNMFRKGCIAWNKGKNWPENVKNKISVSMKGIIPWNKGIPCSKETKAKISLANTGNTWKLSKTTKDRIRVSKIANKNPNWKGEKVGYAALHNWIERHYGKPKKCSHCGTEVAKKYEWANISGKYLRDIKDFIRLCDRCHKAFDNKN